MSKHNISAPAAAASTTASFSDKYFSSSHFSEVFQTGMALVEEAAAYLEGPGRKEAQSLDRDVAFFYATESMRLTSRLMQLASWLLIRNSVLSGELSPDKAVIEEEQLKLKSISQLSTADHFERLPATFRNLVLRSMKLHERILCLDKLLTGDHQLQERDTANGRLDQHALGNLYL